MRFKLYLEYDGTKYSGWQIQNNAKTIQGTIISSIESAFSKLKGTNKFEELHGAGRTDSGVHALEQVAHLECKTVLSPAILKMKVNYELPSDINILEVEKAGHNFHARHSATARQYLYRISKRRTAFEKRYVWWVRDKLDVEVMKQASSILLGMHDFNSFCDDDPGEKSTRVYVEKLDITDEEDVIQIRILASHFLWKMVRRIVGTLAEVGRGTLSVEQISEYLEKFSPEPAKYTAPPSGLFLEKIFYE